MAEKIINQYLLDDDNFNRHSIDGSTFDDRLDWFIPKGGRRGKYMGHAVAVCPFEQHTLINPTTPAGGTAGIFLSLLFQLRKWEYLATIRADEWIEVNPTYAQYYQITIKQKEDLENKIKSGLASVSQAIADLELLKHDERKYREFLEYFGLEYSNGRWIEQKSKDKKNVVQRDEHAIKAMFIDLVDAHTGETLAMRNIVQRWPTLITDFMKMDDTDIDIDKAKDKLNVSKAEAVVLVTKNKLYMKWKKLFEPEIKNRYQRIAELVRSREASVDQYRNWLSPSIARHKMMVESLGSPGGIMGRAGALTSHLYHIGQASSLATTTIWAWRDTQPAEIFRTTGTGSERTAIDVAEGKLDPYDDWTKKNLVFNPAHGLIVKYPWITTEWAQGIRDDVWRPDRLLLPTKPYYAFFIIKFMRGNFRLASGAEMEDSVFDINAIYMSQNVVFTKILESKAKQAEFEHYVDSLIGVRNEKCPICNPTGKPFAYKENKIVNKIKSGFGYLGLDFQFIKGGPYERDFEEMITKRHLLAMGSLRYQPIIRFIKDKIGMGVS